MTSSNAEDVNNAISSAAVAFKTWSQLSAFERGRIIHKASEIVRVCIVSNFLPLDEAIASRAVVANVSGSDEQAGGRMETLLGYSFCQSPK